MSDCMTAPLTELYLFIPLLVTLTVFSGHSSAEQVLLKNCPTVLNKKTQQIMSLSSQAETLFNCYQSDHEYNTIFCFHDVQ